MGTASPSDPFLRSHLMAIIQQQQGTESPASQRVYCDCRGCSNKTGTPKTVSKSTRSRHRRRYQVSVAPQDTPSYTPQCRPIPGADNGSTGTTGYITIATPVAPGSVPETNGFDMASEFEEQLAFEGDFPVLTIPPGNAVHDATMQFYHDILSELSSEFC